jgi:hypothetical protein
MVIPQKYERFAILKGVKTKGKVNDCRRKAVEREVCYRRPRHESDCRVRRGKK